MEYARWVTTLTPEQLDRELADLGAANADFVEEEVERRVQERLRELGPAAGASGGGTAASGRIVLQ